MEEPSQSEDNTMRMNKALKMLETPPETQRNGVAAEAREEINGQPQTVTIGDLRRAVGGVDFMCGGFSLPAAMYCPDLARTCLPERASFTARRARAGLLQQAAIRSPQLS